MAELTEDQVRAKLIGAWRLVAIEVVAPDGTTTNTLGENPVGQISYTENGRMSALLGRRDRPKFASDVAREATDAEALEAFRTFTAYFGPFSIDVEGGTLTHHVEGATLPNMVDTGQVRHFSFEDDRLILGAPNPDGRTRVTWQRV